MIANAPAGQVAVPNVEFTQVVVTPQLIVLGGVTHDPSPNKLVVKMSGNQSSGVSNGWSKTVIITPGMEDDWGEADITRLYLKTIGVDRSWIDACFDIPSKALQGIFSIVGANKEKIHNSEKLCAELCIISVTR